MPIDPKLVQWDAPDPAAVQWDDEKPKAPQEGSRARAQKQSDGVLGRFAANIIPGAIRGAGSIGATLLAPMDALNDRLTGQTGSNDARRKAIDDALQSLGADPTNPGYSVGKVGAEVAGTMGAGPAVGGLLKAAPMAARVPGLVQSIETGGMVAGARAPGAAGLARNVATRAAGGAVAGGASAGLVDPEQAAFGAAVGGALPPALMAAGAAGRGVGAMMRPNINNPALAAKAVNTYGIPLGPADISASRVTKAARSVLNDAPLVGGVGERQGEAVQRGFNRAVGDTFGANADKLTPQVMDAAQQRMGAEFDRIWGGNALQVDGTMMQKVVDLQRIAAKLPRNDGGSLKAEIDDLLSKVQQDANGNLIVPGDVANNFQKYLRRRSEGSSGLKNELNDLRQTIIGAFNRSVSPADAAALTANRTQYKAFKTVEPILRKAEAGVAGREVGDVSAALLPGAALKSYGNGLAGTPFEDLPQIGSQYLVDRVARTGGGPRAALQNAAIGAGLTASTLVNPLALLSLPAAYGAQRAMGSPELARRMLQAPTQQNALMRLLADPRAQQLGYLGAPVAVTSGGR